eukprot:CAMPEP_0202476622 /NCGR_PEP_ID=MMETSP1360-20130828/93515_1 /ASSEMBLY_ACC=CAM_ASM_000848 /TAXON_ID=515479 /ORGANISM="Licmophora paradoxa, Strain CCMP2313" /LENGTH=1218 /DNA_ID=CAMNT_0049103835 /DNA_START=54 /DNA_END=3708 /DNA_ORIENTATION=+
MVTLTLRGKIYAFMLAAFCHFTFFVNKWSGGNFAVITSQLSSPQSQSQSHQYEAVSFSTFFSPLASSSASTTSTPPPSLRCTSEEKNRMKAMKYFKTSDTIQTESTLPLTKPWIEQMIHYDHQQKQQESPRTGQTTSDPNDSTYRNSRRYRYKAISVGCNKGMGAVETARILSNNKQFDRKTWYQAMTQVAGVDKFYYPGSGQEVKHEDESMFMGEEHDGAQAEVFNLEMHCVEPLPDNVNNLLKVTQQLEFTRSSLSSNAISNVPFAAFRVHPYAISSKASTAKFPVDIPPGREDFGIDACSSNVSSTRDEEKASISATNNDELKCQAVQVVSLDGFVERHISSSGMIDFLQIDAGDFNFEVLQGGKNTLARTRYLEFEYHDIGMWKQQTLEDAVRVLDEQHGFTCYLLGKSRLFRLTKCWIDVFGSHTRSNIGCVSRNEVNWALIMESVFVKTIYSTSQHLSSSLEVDQTSDSISPLPLIAEEAMGPTKRINPPATACTQSQMSALLKMKFLETQDTVTKEGGDLPHRLAWKERMILEEQLIRKKQRIDGESEPIYRSIHVGCGNGTRAINHARLLSRNQIFNPRTWTYHLFQNTNRKKDPEMMLKLYNERVPVPDNLKQSDKFDIDFHCIEPRPDLFETLDKNPKDGMAGFRIHNLALAEHQGWTKFPQKLDHQGNDLPSYSEYCQSNQCKEIETLTLDQFASSFIPNGLIDTLYLNIGQNGDKVLKGGTKTLDRTRYLEFEHFISDREQSELPSIVERLNTMGFTCYLMGENRLFKMTGCWTDKYSYNTETLTNVGCVHRSEKAWLSLMDDVFNWMIESPTNNGMFWKDFLNDTRISRVVETNNSSTIGAVPAIVREEPKQKCSSTDIELLRKYFGAVPAIVREEPKQKCSATDIELLRKNKYLASGLTLLKESRKPKSDSWFESMIRLDYSLNQKKQYRGVSIGCNKGIDAVGVARLLSWNTVFSPLAWNREMTKIAGIENFPYKEEISELEISPSDLNNTREVEFHCVEPLPVNIRALEQSNTALGLEKWGFYTHHYALSNQSGSVPFPVNDVVGEEALGIDACIKPDVKDSDAESKCEDVAMFTLDEFSHNHIPKGIIDVLLIDVEGYDFLVLKEGKDTLSRTRYLEFEYHGIGPWVDQKLEDAVSFLDDLGFTCYFLGQGRLFRLTGCWIDNFEIHRWSNVGCVHRLERHWLAIMESISEATMIEMIPDW